MISRRGVLIGAGGVGAVGLAGFAIAPRRVKRLVGLGADPFIPDAPEGEVTLERITSEHLGEIDLLTAVPHGYGDGAGLPVVVALHGSSQSAAALPDFGLPRFVTAAVEAGAPPFVLVATDDGPDGWLPANGAEPQAMLRDELPGWLDDRGFDAERRALWGWSRGGYGALRFLQAEPDWAEALALYSPAMAPGDPAFDDLGVLETVPWGLWCATDDPYTDASVALAEQAPVAPDPWVQGTGGHTWIYWNNQTLDMLGWITGAFEA